MPWRFQKSVWIDLEVCSGEFSWGTVKSKSYKINKIFSLVMPYFNWKHDHVHRKALLMFAALSSEIWWMHRVRQSMNRNMACQWHIFIVHHIRNENPWKKIISYTFSFHIYHQKHGIVLYFHRSVFLTNDCHQYIAGRTSKSISNCSAFTQNFHDPNSQMRHEELWSCAIWQWRRVGVAFVWRIRQQQSQTSFEW